MEKTMDTIDLFRKIYLSIDKTHLDKSRKVLCFENASSSISIFKTNNLWKTHFKVPSFIGPNGEYDFKYMDFCVYLSDEVLAYMFGANEILGDAKNKKMILVSRFLRFENYLGVFSKELHPMMSLRLDEKMKEAVLELLSL